MVSNSEIPCPGMIIEFNDNETRRYLRVLFCIPHPAPTADDECDGTPQLILINILDASAWPFPISYQQALEFLHRGIWKQYDGIDPFAFSYRNKDEVPTSHRDKYILHQSRTAIYVHAVSDDRPNCYNPLLRRRLQDRSAEVHNVSKSLVRKWLRLFWQSGEDENSLWPRHRFAGTPTIEEALEKIEILPKRRGRPRRFTPDIKPPDIAKGEEDLALASRTRDELLLKGWDEYIHENQNSRLISSGTGIPYTDAFRYTISRYFATRTKLLPNRRSIPTTTVVDTREDLLPTIRQFKRVVETNREAARTIKELQGAKLFNLNWRLKAGDTRPRAAGPGSCYHVDWMLADVYLVNRVTGMPCGRPYVFFVVDAFSRILVGMHVTFAPPDYRSAAQALLNTFTRKGPYMARHAVSLEPDQWPCHHLCWRVLGDNGELASKESDTIVRSAASAIGNTPPFRADLKELVENSFRCGNTGTIRFLPGVTRGPRERCAPDPRLQSQLNVIQFTGLLIHWAVTVFNTRVIEKYSRTELMARYPVSTTPIDLWKWGFEHLGRPRQMPIDEVRRRLMPVADATVREDGIWLQNVCFVSNDATVAEYLFRAQHHGNFDLPCSYDPACTDGIDLLGGLDVPPLRVPISQKSSDIFGGKSFQEVAMFMDDDGASHRIKRQINERARRDDRARARRIISEAGSIMAAQHGGLEKRNNVVQLSDPTTERQSEIQAMRQADNRELAVDAPKPQVVQPKTKPRAIDIRARFLQEK